MTEKKENQLDNKIKRYIEKKHFVKIIRNVTDAQANLSGFILLASNDFILVQIEEEFNLNGYAIIRKDHFESIRCNKFDKTTKRILQEEGIIDAQYGIKNAVELADWKSIFEELMKLDFHVIVECEDLENPVFLIGPIKEIKNKSVTIQYYSPAGVLDKKATKVKYKDITLLKFDDRYTKVFRKHLKRKK